jgi:hypothetical protein
MHLVRELVEIWALMGVATVLVGLLWTSKSVKEAQPKTAMNIPSVSPADSPLSEIQAA